MAAGRFNTIFASFLILFVGTTHINAAIINILVLYWPDVPLGPICTTFGLRADLVDLLNCAKFYCNRLRDSDFVGRIFTSSIGRA